jgi:hypothetical protein
LTGHLAQFVRHVIRHQEAPTSLALYRILLCSSALYSLAIMGDQDVFEATWVSSRDGGLTHLSSRHWLFSALGGFDANAVRNLYHLSLCLLTFGLIGFGGRATLLFAQQSYVALRTINENSSGGYDSLICLGLLLLGCASSTATLSVDCRLMYGRFWRLTPVSAWPRALLVFQLLLMYSMTGIQKIGHSWTPMGGYTALHYVLNDPTWLRWDLGKLPEMFGPLLRIATAVTWHWEQLSLLLLLHWYFRNTDDTSPSWLRRLFLRWDLRYPWAAIGLMLHVSILVLFDIGPFSIVSLAYYVNLWAPREWHVVYRWLATHWRAQSAETKSD